MVNSSGPPSEEAMKTRIIKHMNNDHQESLVRYLEHYSQLPSHTARHARIIDLSLAWLLLSTSSSSSNSQDKPTFSKTPRNAPNPKHTLNNGQYLIPFDPPLSSFSQCRQRVVEMDKICVTALGRSDITVKAYRRTQGFHWFFGLGFVMTFVLLGWRPNLAPASVASGGAWAEVKRRWPSVFAFLYTVQPFVWYPMVMMHLGEAYHMDRTRLRTYSVPRLSKLWWQWIISTLFDGFGSFHRLDALVKEERIRKEKAKH